GSDQEECFLLRIVSVAPATPPSPRADPGPPVPQPGTAAARPRISSPARQGPDLPKVPTTAQYSRSAAKNALAFCVGGRDFFENRAAPSIEAEAMLYQVYKAHGDIMGPGRALARAANVALDRPLNGLPAHGLVRNLSAAYELIARAGLTHERPSFDIDRITVGNREVEVRQKAARVTPFATLLHFEKDAAA